jgi:hypothetical protein
MFIYVYNVFLGLAFGILILRSAYLLRSIRPLVVFSVGFIVCVLFYIGVLYATGSSIKETLGVLTAHGGGIKAEIAPEASAGLIGALKKIYAAFLQLPITNVFRYNLAILFLFLISIPFVAGKALREKSERHLLYLFLVVAIVIQSAMVMSYPFKKLIIIFPILVIMLADVVPFLMEYNLSIQRKKKLILIIYYAFAVGVCLINFKLNNSETYWRGLNYGYYANTGIFFNSLNLLIFGLVVLVMIIAFFYPKDKLKFVLVIPAFTGVFLILQYCFIDKTFHSRDGFSKASAILQNKGVIKSACYAAQFYTNCKPALGCYADMMLLGEEYETVADNTFRSGKAEFTIQKIMPSEYDKPKEIKGFDLVSEIPMRYYVFRIYKYSHNN